eukprot:g4481.t1
MTVQKNDKRVHPERKRVHPERHRKVENGKIKVKVKKRKEMDEDMSRREKHRAGRRHKAKTQQGGKEKQARAGRRERSVADDATVGDDYIGASDTQVEHLLEVRANEEVTGGQLISIIESRRNLMKNTRQRESERDAQMRAELKEEDAEAADAGVSAMPFKASRQVRAEQSRIVLIFYALLVAWCLMVGIGVWLTVSGDRDTGYALLTAAGVLFLIVYMVNHNGGYWM